jgi:hypothetical protein
MIALTSSEAKYSSAYPAKGFTASLAALGPSQGTPDENHAGFVDAALSTGTKDGYQFAVSIPAGTSTGGTNFNYFIVGKPAAGHAGSSFCADSSGAVHYNRQGEECTAASPTIASFFGVWNKEGGGYVKVIISGSPEKPRVHLWGAAFPQAYDAGEEDAIWDGSTLTSTFRQDGGPTVFRFTLDQNANLQLNCHYVRANGEEGDCQPMSGYTKTPLDVGGDDTPQTPR